LSNHLGNVLVTVSDKKIAVDSDNDGTINYYNADVVTANEYYPFGMQMPGRKYSQPNSAYRYGFNGQENSDEIAAGLTTAMYWEYDSRIGRRWNVDPVDKDWESPYACFSNNPIWNLDSNGDSDSTQSAVVVKRKFNENETLDAVIVTSVKKEKKSFWQKLGSVVDKVTDYIPVVGGIKNAVKHAVKGEWGAALLSVAEAGLDAVTLIGTGGIGNLVKAGIKEGGKAVLKRIGKEVVENFLTEKIGFSPHAALKLTKKIFKKGGKIPIGCFVKGTLVWTKNGFKRIEDVRKNEKVYAYRIKNGKIVLKRVLLAYEREVTRLIKIEFGTEFIYTTNEHPFYINKNWVEASKLKTGDELFLGKSGNFSISKITIIDTIVKVFNITVADEHNYFVSKQKVLVHNNNPCSPTNGLKKFGPNVLAEVRLDKQLAGSGQLSKLRDQFNVENFDINELLSMTPKEIEEFIKGKDGAKDVIRQLKKAFQDGGHFW
jgi:RHS repeat-associated protein